MKLATIILSHFVRIYDIILPVKEEGSTNIGKAYLAQRKDGKYYRGQKGWKWCNNPRNAAFLNKSFWEEYYVNYKFKELGIEVNLIKATDISI